MDDLLRVHKRIIDGLDGSLIGKQGGTVKSIQESSNCIVRVLGVEDLPISALQDDRVVEVVGDAVGVHKAIELIASHLRKFLVDRSIIPIFEMRVNKGQRSWSPAEGRRPAGWWWWQVAGGEIPAEVAGGGIPAVVARGGGWQVAAMVVVG
ncbi:unnamed protein product [Prunus armeniaca]